MKNEERDLYQQLSDIFLQEGSFFNPADILKRAANRYEKRIAVWYKGESFSYSQLFYRASFWEEKLKEKGIKPGDQVALFLQNSPAFYIAYCAAWQLGAVVVPLNTFLKSPELKHIIDHSDIKAIFIDQTLLSVWSELDHDGVLVITDSDIASVSYDAHTVKNTFFSGMSCYDPDALSVLIFTSGTTGKAKGVMLTGRSIMTNVCQSIARLGFAEHEIVAAVLPLFHVFAQTASFWISFLLGATVVLIPKIERAFLYEALAYQPTVFVGVPALYGFLCMLKNAQLGSVRLFVSGGDALPDKIRMYFAFLYGRLIANGYGLSETSPVIALSMNNSLGVTNSVGKPLLGIACQIRDLDGKVCAGGIIGILFIKSPSVMKGYYHNESETQTVFSDDWFCTGDFAFLTNQGALVITGRYKDLIVNKGLNIYPQEVENVLLMHPDVIRAAVIGFPDQLSGQIPIAFVQIKQHNEAIIQELEDLCRMHLASYKIPRKITVTSDSLPLTSTGKIDKKLLL